MNEVEDIIREALEKVGYNSKISYLLTQNGYVLITPLEPYDENKPFRNATTATYKKEVAQSSILSFFSIQNFIKSILFHHKNNFRVFVFFITSQPVRGLASYETTSNSFTKFNADNPTLIEKGTRNKFYYNASDKDSHVSVFLYEFQSTEHHENTYQVQKKFSKGILYHLNHAGIWQKLHKSQHPKP